MLENIRDGGKLIVEDTHTSYMERFGPRKYSFIKYTKMLIDAVNQRFESFDGKHAERRIWSIAIYESIVSFSVNQKASYQKSTKNNGEWVKRWGARLSVRRAKDLVKPAREMEK
jgi:hypothetical protein